MQSRLLQHLLVPVLVVLPMGRETAAVAPVFFDRNLKKGDRIGFERGPSAPDRSRRRGSSTYRLQRGEGRPGLEAVLGDEPSTREGRPVPAVMQVAVEMRVPVEGVVWIQSHPSFLLRFSPVCGTGDEEGPSPVLLKVTSDNDSSSL